MKIDNRSISDNAEKLEKHKGYLPFLIREHINSENWMNFMEKEGLLEEVMPQIRKIRKSSFQDKINEFVSWVNEHPEYKEFLED